jgi:hypothetical protein
MDFDFLDHQLLDSSRDAIKSFKSAVEQVRPSPREMEELCDGIRAYPHTAALKKDFTLSAVDGSGEFPVLQQDDIFLHFATAAGATYRTVSARQNKLISEHSVPPTSKQFVVLSDNDKLLRQSYLSFLRRSVDMDLPALVEGSDYCQVFGQFGKTIRSTDVTWRNISLSKASQVASHAYLLRSLAELAMAVRMLSQEPRYVLLDSSLVYFLLGDVIFLPELLKRYLICRANEQGTGVVALCKSHNIPNGNFIGRHARDELGMPGHWYLRLPSVALGEQTPAFLKGKEIPPKLSVSYLFKFEPTAFPMRIDVDAAWWNAHISGDEAKEQELFGNLDFTCHEVRSYGYPYPMHAAHRSASLTAQERKMLRDIVLQNAQHEGVGPMAFDVDPEELHMSGM